MHRVASVCRHRAAAVRCSSFVLASTPRSLAAAVSDTTSMSTTTTNGSSTRQFWMTSPTSLADKNPEAASAADGGPFAGSPFPAPDAAAAADAAPPATAAVGATPAAAPKVPKEKVPKTKPALIPPLAVSKSHTVHTSDIANSVSLMHALPKQKSKEIVESVFKLMALTLQQKIPISLSGFGTFKLAVSKERMARNPQTGDQIKVPQKNRIAFKAFDTLKKSMQDDYVPPEPKPPKRGKKKAEPVNDTAPAAAATTK